MILFLDTSRIDKLIVAISSRNGRLRRKFSVQTDYNQSEKILPLIEDILESQDIKLSDLTGLCVLNGPGGFTSLRIGISTANALAYTLNIPVVGYSRNQFSTFSNLAQKASKKLLNIPINNVVIPKYGREPNITKAKKKTLHF